MRHTHFCILIYITPQIYNHDGDISHLHLAITLGHPWPGRLLLLMGAGKTISVELGMSALVLQDQEFKTLNVKVSPDFF